MTTEKDSSDGVERKIEGLEQAIEPIPSIEALTASEKLMPFTKQTQV